MKKLDFILLFFAVMITVLVLFACKKEAVTYMGSDTGALSLDTITVPAYFPQMIIPADNQLTKEGVALGRKLYYDPILSNTGQSCSSCHEQSSAFSFSGVNSMPHMNLAWNSNFLWNGAVAGSLEDAMTFEVDVFFHTNIEMINSNVAYQALFKRVFKANRITSKQIAYALAQFVRKQVSYRSRMDKFLSHEGLLTPSEINGFVIYNSERGDCFHCHSLGLFTDNGFHNIGIDSVFFGANAGRYAVTGNINDLGKFKTPSLRNVALTAPYMHDGRFTTLEEVIDHYDSGVMSNVNLDPIFSKPNHLNGLHLSAQEKADLVAFLEALTDSSFVNDPSLCTP